MIRQPIYRYYYFGTCVRFLQDADERYHLSGDGNVLENIDAFFRDLRELGLSVSARVANQRFDDIRKPLKEGTHDRFLSAAEAKAIRDAMDVIRVTLDAELMEAHAYTPTEKRLDLNKLLQKPTALFGPGVFQRLPDIAKSDFSAAGQCIAFEIPTAAAFHLMRGVEAVLRMYYESMVKRNRIKSRNWGPLVADLRRRRKPQKHEALNNQLDNIRESFRNPTQHPDAVYDIHEAQDLYSVCVDVVNRMIRLLRDESRT